MHIIVSVPFTSKNEEGMTARVREMAGLIKSRLEMEWAAWEVDVLKRVACDTDEVRGRLRLFLMQYTS